MLLSVMDQPAAAKRKKKKKVNDRPKRPLSAYNLFFQSERDKILRSVPEMMEGKPRRSHGKIGFAQLARAIAERWNSIHELERRYYDGKAAEDKIRYARELEEWNMSRADDEVTNGGMSGDDEKKPASRVSRRIKIVPPLIAPRMPITDEAGGKAAMIPGFVPLAAMARQPDTSVYPLSNYQDLKASLLQAHQNQDKGSPHCRDAHPQDHPGITRSKSFDQPMENEGSMARLAEKLDDESIDFIIRLFPK
jgi:hypothetical protein